MGRSTGGKGSAFALAETLEAVTAVQQVCQEGDPLAMVGGPAGPSIPGATSQEILQVLCEQSISAAGRKAAGVAIAAVPGALQRLITLMQVSASSGTYMCLIDAGQAYSSRQVYQEWGSKVSPELLRRALAQCRAGKAKHCNRICDTQAVVVALDTLYAVRHHIV